jgi:hypothetical protein
MPGAFPSEALSSSEHGGSDLEYDYDDDDYLDSYDPGVEDSYFASEPEATGLTPETLIMRENEEDGQSASSYDDMYPVDDFPFDEDLHYEDPTMPTPPTSSQFSSSQAEPMPELSQVSPSMPTSPEASPSQSSAIEVSSSEGSSTGADPSVMLLPSPSAEIELSAEQHHVLRRVLAGESVFFTGSAGQCFCLTMSSPADNGRCYY